MKFIEPKENDFQKYKPLLSVDEMTCENSYLNAILWKNVYKYEYCLNENSLIIRLCDGEEYLYFLPLGDNFEDNVNAIIKEENGHPIFCVSDGERFEKFKEIFGENFDCSPIPENFEYIYNRTDLAELVGKKYHQKRNHISAFSRKYEWRYETLTKDNICDVFAVSDEWLKEKDSEFQRDLLLENESIKNALSHLNELSIIGGIVYVGEKPVAYCFGTALNQNVFDVNIEKALSEYQGAYAVINNEFVKRELSSFEYVNREDDLGIDGLRRAKLSYQPCQILKKYIIKI